MRKKSISIVTAFMMVLTMFGYGGAIAVSATETENYNIEETAAGNEVVGEETVEEVQPSEATDVSPSTASTQTDIGYGTRGITTTFRDGLYLDQWGESSSLYNYTGKAIYPKIDLVLAGYDASGNWSAVNLQKDVDYTITYPDNAINPGEYTIVFQGIGKYTGTRSVSFKIQNIEVPAVKNVKVSTAKKSPYVKFDAVKLDGATIKYKVLYRTGSNVAWTTATSGTTKTKVTVKKLASQKKYTVAVIPIATVDGKVYEGNATIKNVKGYAPSGTAINSADDFVSKINANTSGKFYLTNNIELPANTKITEKFTGTLDGNGFAIKNYKYSSSKWCEVGVFRFAEGATFKNINMTGVNINITSNTGAYIGSLVYIARDCTFSNIKTTGKITVSGSNTTYDGAGGFTVGGIVGTASGSKISKCSNAIDIKVTSRLKYGGVDVGGISSSNPKPSSKKSATTSSCTNTGDISIIGYSDEGITAGGVVAGSAGTVTSCKNSGKISITYDKEQEPYGGHGAFGICGGAYSISSCKNTGSVTVKTNSSCRLNGAHVAGVVGERSENGGKILKCSNKGAVTFSGNAVGSAGAVKVGGVAVQGYTVQQCYNKGKVYVKTSSDWVQVGGLCAEGGALKNNYNAATVTASSSKGNVGGLVGEVYGQTYYNYNSGKVSGTKGMYIGSVAGIVHSEMPPSPTDVKYNYFKSGTASKGYGMTEVTWHKSKPQVTKVSAISKAKCKKLSSTYWKYSKKAKRMVLKNNAE